MNDSNNMTPPVTGARYDDAGDEIDLGQLIGVLSEGRLWIAAFVVAAVFLGAFYSWVSAREYQSSAMVQVEQKGGSSLEAALGDLGESLGQETPTAAEIELLKSRMVVGRVVDQLRDFIRAEPHYFPVVGRAIARGYEPEDGNEEGVRKAPLGLRSFAWGGEVIRVTNLETGSRLIGKQMTLRAGENGRFDLIGPEGKPLLENAPVGELIQENTELGPIVMFVQDLVAAPGTRFTVVRQDRNRVISSLINQLGVSERGRQSGILSVTASGPSPEAAADRVNHLVQAYQRQNVERKSQEAQQTLDFLNNQLPELKKELEAAEARLNQYRLREGSADLTKETELVLERSVELESRRNELEQKRQESTRRYTEDHPVIQTIDAQIANVQRDIDALREEVGRLPETQQELLRLRRDVEVNTELYTALLNSAQELQVARAGTVGNVRVVDLGIIPEEPSKPRVALVIALSLVLGGMLGVVVVFLRRALRQGIDDPAAVERDLGLATYAAVPFSWEQKKLERDWKRRSKRGEKLGLLAFEQPQDVTIEALRSLRTSLHFALLDAPSRIITITGPSPGLGKSFLAANFSAVLAEAGQKVVVIDADLRRGHMHERFNTERAPGVSDYIAGDATVEDIIRADTGSENLRFVATGRIAPNPAELLLSDRFKELLSTLEERFDYIIVDTPPVLAVTDASIVGRLSGATLLVLKEGEHPMAMVADTQRRLQRAGVSVRGTIFNQMGRTAGRYGGKGAYGYKYGYTYEYTARKA